MAQAAALVSAVATAVVLAGSPASAAGGFWATGCQDGRACIYLSHLRVGGMWWNVDGCGDHPIQDYYRSATAHGNPFNVVYVNGTWDRVNPWTTRPLDPNNLVTQVIVLC
ncbi:hypothetical protein [Streptomyces sp. NPDC057616]|uniref:hypothetical protein n=1 Tax=Streptomyces sp. NPDC057616 TaxID=3346183 RepID=UPI00369353DE